MQTFTQHTLHTYYTHTPYTPHHTYTPTCTPHTQYTHTTLTTHIPHTLYHTLHTTYNTLIPKYTPHTHHTHATPLIPQKYTQHMPHLHTDTTNAQHTCLHQYTHHTHQAHTLHQSHHKHPDVYTHPTHSTPRSAFHPRKPLVQQAGSTRHSSLCARLPALGQTLVVGLRVRVPDPRPPHPLVLMGLVLISLGSLREWTQFFCPGALLSASTLGNTGAQCTVHEIQPLHCRGPAHSAVLVYVMTQRPPSWGLKSYPCRHPTAETVRVHQSRCILSRDTSGLHGNVEEEHLCHPRCGREATFSLPRS